MLLGEHSQEHVFLAFLKLHAVLLVVFESPFHVFRNKVSPRLDVVHGLGTNQPQLVRIFFRDSIDHVIKPLNCFCVVLQTDQAHHLVEGVFMNVKTAKTDIAQVGLR